MKKVISVLALYLVFLSVINAAIIADIQVNTFWSQDGPYVECFLYVMGNSLTGHMNADGQWETEVNVIVSLTREDITEINKSFVLVSPVKDFKADIEYLWRDGINPGTWNVEVSFTDADNTENILIVNRTKTVSMFAEGPNMSGVYLLSDIKTEGLGETFKRNNMYLHPLPFNILPGNKDVLSAYLELYTLDEGDQYFLGYGVEQPVGDEFKRVMKYEKLDSKDITPKIISLSTAGLPPGKHSLVLQIRSKAKNIIHEETIAFIKPDLDAIVDIPDDYLDALTHEQAEYAVRAIAPHIHQGDSEKLNELIARGNVEEMREFLYKYWRFFAPANPSTSYHKYMMVADYVNQVYDSGFGYGFETDRGLIYMKYGRPNDVLSVEDDPVAYPYEIWVYHDFPVTNQSNVKFLFYNPDLISNGHQLLHSNARGERYNPSWQARLYAEAPDQLEDDYQNAREVKDGVNRHAAQYLEDF